MSVEIAARAANHDREEIALGVFDQEPGIESVAATDGELVQEPRPPDQVAVKPWCSTRALDEGPRQPGLANAGRAGDQQIVLPTNPRARNRLRTTSRFRPGGVVKLTSSSDAGYRSLTFAGAASVSVARARSIPC